MKPRIAIVTAHTHHIHEYTAFTFAIFKAYATKHGYDFKIVNDGFDLSKPLSWSKILFVSQQLPQYDYVMWLDADIVITNPEIKIEDIVATYPEASVMICEEEFAAGKWSNVYRKNLNTGSMIFKNDTFSFDLIDLINKTDKPYSDYRWPEQSRLIEIIENKETDLSKLQLCHKKLFNSLYVTNDWSESDFLIHFAAYDMCFGTPKLGIIKQYAATFFKKLPIDYPAIEAYFSQAVFINLDRRMDRRTTFQENCKKIHFSPKRISAIDGKSHAIPSYVFRYLKPNFTPSTWAITKTTKNIILQAKENQYKSVLICEDDIDFDPHANEYLFHAMLNAPNDWECLMLAYLGPPTEKVNDYWQKSIRHYTCAMYVVRDTMYDSYLHFLQNNPIIPIDEWLAKYIQTKGKTYTLHKAIAWQTTSFGDNLGKERIWKKGPNNENMIVS